MSKFQVGDKVRINTPGESEHWREVTVTLVHPTESPWDYSVQITSGETWSYKESELEGIKPTLPEREYSEGERVRIKRTGVLATVARYVEDSDLPILILKDCEWPGGYGVHPGEHPSYEWNVEPL